MTPNKIPMQFLARPTLTDVAVAFQYQVAPTSPDGQVLQDLLREHGIQHLARSYNYREEAQYPSPIVVSKLAHRWLIWDAVYSLWGIATVGGPSKFDMVGEFTKLEREQIHFIQQQYLARKPEVANFLPENRALYFARQSLIPDYAIHAVTHTSNFGRLSVEDNQRARLLIAMCQKKLLGTDFPFAGLWGGPE